MLSLFLWEAMNISKGGYISFVLDRISYYFLALGIRNSSLELSIRLKVPLRRNFRLLITFLANNVRIFIDSI